MLLREDVVIKSTDAKETADDERTVTEIPTQLANANNTHHNNNICSNQQQSNDAGIFSEQESAVCILKSGVVYNLQSIDESVRRFPLSYEQVDAQCSTFLKPVSNNVKMTFGIANRLDYAEIKEPPVMLRKCVNFVNSDLRDSTKLFPLLDEKRRTNSTFPCYTVGTIGSVSQNSRETQREESTNVETTHYLTDNTNNEPKNHQELNFQTAPTQRILFPLHKSGRCEIFPVEVGNRHTNSTFPWYTVGTIGSESQSTREIQREVCAAVEKNLYPNELKNFQELNLRTVTAQRILFPLHKNNENITHPNNFPTNFKETKAKIMNADFLANNITELSTGRSCHHNFAPPTTTTTTMTHCLVSNSGHARGIQVQYNQQMLNTIENGPDLKRIINCCVHEPQQKQEQQHINDAKLATATMAKNTTVATTSSQNNDEHNICFDRREPPNQLSSHKSHRKNDQQNHLAKATPPPLSEILAKILEETRLDLWHAIGTLNKQTFYAASQLHRPPTPATCSDVRDSSTQEVPLREDSVSVKVVTQSSPSSPPRLLPENKQEEYNLELLPKLYALERHDDDGELNWPEVDQLIENNEAIIVFSNNEQQATNNDEENDKWPEPERETEILDDVATLLTLIEETSEQVECESSVNVDDSAEQIYEMKFEMKSAKSNLPERETIRRHSHEFKNEPNIGSLGGVGQRPASALTGVTRTPTVESKYARSANDQPSVLRTATTLHGSVPTGVAMPVKYARANEQYSASRPANTLPVSVSKEFNAPLIDTKYRSQAKDEPRSATRFANNNTDQRTGNLDTKYARTKEEPSALKSATTLQGAGVRAVNSPSLKDTKYNRIKDEPSATKFANSLYGGIQNTPTNYEHSNAKSSNLSSHTANRTGYTAPLVDSKYNKNNEPSSATNRSSLLLAGSRSANSSSLLDSKYAKHEEPSATNLSTVLHGATRSANSSSLFDSKYVKTNDEPPSATKLSSMRDTRPLSLLESKYAKINDETSGARHPHSVTRTTEALPLFDARTYGKTYVEPSALSDIGRSVSVEGLSATIPKSTRLRRQRRMHSQGSQEQPEDTIERLNRLRARISGALSEVKGVLKHYSTETEPELEAEKQNESVDVSKNDAVSKVETSQEAQQPSEETEGPVTFRFVKKIRRRSFFDENEEDKEKQAEELTKTVSMETEKSNEEQVAVALENRSEAESVVKENLELAKPVIEEAEKNNEKLTVSEIEGKCEKVNIANGNCESIEPALIVSKAADVAILIEKQEEFKAIPNLGDIQEKQSLEVLKEPTTTEADAAVVKKPKKKILVKTGVSRRASIAAVEVSKIEPPITPTLSLNLKTQRRPSDSEAIVKKKVIPKITANGATTSKATIIHKVKRPSVKRTNAISTEQNKTITSEAAAAPTAAINSENSNNSSDINDRANFSSKDATTVAMTLAAQLVIDDASLTIAATKDDATSLAPIGLEEANAVMVATTPLSPLRTSETNRQIEVVPKSEKLVKIVGETVTVGTAPKSTITPTTPEYLIPEKIPKFDDSSCVPLEIIDAKFNERLKSAVAEKFEEKASVQLREGEKLIDQKVIPAQQQVFADTAVLQDSATTFTSKPPDVITSDIAKETSLPSPTSTSIEPINVDATKARITATTINSAEVTSPSDTSSATSAEAAAMPELQVKALQAFLKPLVAAPFNVTKDDSVKKKVVVRKLIRKNSTEKTQKSNLQTVAEEQKNIRNAATKDKSKNLTLEDITIEDATSPTEDKLSPIIAKNDDVNDWPGDWPGDVNEVIEDVIEEVIEEEEPAPDKKKRRIKKKVIIKRQPRKLSISDTFFKGPDSEPSSPIEETLEKPVEYVKVDSDEEQDYEDIVKPAQPSKSCLKLREFQVGDPVMYAERYKKTQVRWKRGIVLERITSISYKLEVEGKEVPAHISYIKKFTDRKVNFSGKEYLEIDYEQIAEEEEKARRYSIWNMV